MSDKNGKYGVHISDILNGAGDEKTPDFWQLRRIAGEFAEGFALLNSIGNAASIFGSARIGKDDRHYKDAHKLGFLLSQAGIVVITGGGPGIMEAANRGAFENGSESIGLNVKLPHEQKGNAYTTQSLTFKHFFVRKYMLVKYVKAFVFYPGGFGTMDEFFEIITLIQTRKVYNFPIILMDSAYWSGLLDWLKTQMITRNYIVPADLGYLKVLDTSEEAAEHIIRYFKEYEKNSEKAMI